VLFLWDKQLSCETASPILVKILVIAGEVFGILGDLFLNYQFLVGGGFFAICHVCYLIAFFPIRDKQQNVLYSKLILSGVIAVVGDACCLFIYFLFTILYQLFLVYITLLCNFLVLF
jgi:hypothetical protein